MSEDWETRNAIAWIIDAIKDQAKEVENSDSRDNLEERLCKIKSYVFVIEVLENWK